MNRLGFQTVALAVFALTAGAAALAGPTQPFKVTSSLDHKRVLPLRSRWLAYPKLPPSKVKEVDFLIDGKVRWIEHKAPYNYGSDDFHGHLGYLITTWLAPGQHKFAARVVDVSGRRATDTVVARVLPAPAPPPELAGAWTRTITSADQQKAQPQYGDPPPTGAWKLIFDTVGAWHLDPMGSGVVNQYNVRPGGTLDVYAPIVIAPQGISKYGASGIGCCDCREDGPFGTYTWTVSGDTLTLKAEQELCGDRQAIWEGTWTRVR
jgi:hypothetical protein